MAKIPGPFRRVLTIVSRRPRRFQYRWQSINGRIAGERAVRIARQEIGATEHPHGSNLQKYGEYWGENGVPWCGLFVAWCWDHAGLNVTRELAHKVDYVPELVSFAKEKRHRLALIHPRRVRAGDAVALDFDGGVADHVELFDHWVDRRRGVFATVGGNTSRRGSQSNGGEVVPQIRRMGQVVAFVRKLPPVQGH